MRIAITRKVSPGIVNCELTHLARAPIDFALAERQHAAYEQSLRQLGCAVTSLPAEPDLPDSVFVEDAAVVFAELAIITRPGAESRRPETTSIAATLRRFRELRCLAAPATLDGGDVLCVGSNVYAGQTSRTNAAALEQIRAFLEPHGYRVTGVAVHGCLHLKSAVTQVNGDTLLINPGWVSAAAFPNLRLIEIAPAEPYAANALRIGDRVIYPTAFPETRARLQREGIRVAEVDVSELAKAEGAVTCCSLIFDDSEAVTKPPERQLTRP